MIQYIYPAFDHYKFLDELASPLAFTLPSCPLFSLILFFY
jgi:hypothetical protein